MATSSALFYQKQPRGGKNRYIKVDANLIVERCATCLSLLPLVIWTTVHKMYVLLFASKCALSFEAEFKSLCSSILALSDFVLITMVHVVIITIVRFS